MGEKDSIYSKPMTQIGDFQFDESVAGVFTDMIQRSVPGYATMLAMVREIAQRYVTPNSRVYDLGCSLGGATLAIRDRIPRDCVIEAVDSSPAMVSRFQAVIDQDKGNHCAVIVKEEDIRDVTIKQASLVLLNFTLQFIPTAERTGLLRSIAEGTSSGGALVLSEKIRFADEQHDRSMIELHHGFKRANGYSNLEIAQKRTALENRLIPETLETHVQRLQAAGYAQVVPWFQAFNFVSILAWKS